MRLIEDLEKAIKNGDHSRVYQILAEPDFDINQIGRCDWSPLLIAVNLNNEKYVETFLKMGANPNWCLSANEGPSILHFAVYKKVSVKIIELLLKYGARESYSTTGNQTPLHIVAKQGNTEIVKLFLAYGFNPHLKMKFSMEGNPLSAIELAELNCHKALAQFMRTYELPSIKPLLKANTLGDFSYAKVFFQMKRDTKLPPIIVDRIRYEVFYRQGQKNSNDSVVKATQQNDITMLNSLKNEGYSLFDNNMVGMSNPPLNQAILNGNYNIAELLIRHGAIITKSECALASPYSCADGKPEIQKLLLDTKIRQLEIFKNEFGLENQNPQTCSLR